MSGYNRRKYNQLDYNGDKNSYKSSGCWDYKMERVGSDRGSPRKGSGDSGVRFEIIFKTELIGSSNPRVQQATDLLFPSGIIITVMEKKEARLFFEELSAGLTYLEKQILSTTKRGVDFWNLVKEAVGMRLLAKISEK